METKYAYKPENILAAFSRRQILTQDAKYIYIFRGPLHVFRVRLNIFTRPKIFLTLAK